MQEYSGVRRGTAPKCGAVRYKSKAEACRLHINPRVFTSFLRKIAVCALIKILFARKMQTFLRLSGHKIAEGFSHALAKILKKEGVFVQN